MQCSRDFLLFDVVLIELPTISIGTAYKYYEQFSNCYVFQGCQPTRALEISLIFPLYGKDFAQCSLLLLSALSHNKSHETSLGQSMMSIRFAK